MLTYEDIKWVETSYMEHLNAKEEALGSMKTITKFHATWGPDAFNKTKEELLGYLLEIENSPKIRIDPADIGRKTPKVDVRDWLNTHND